jgi:hypothetical protein
MVLNKIKKSLGVNRNFKIADIGVYSGLYIVYTMEKQWFQISLILKDFSKRIPCDICLVISAILKFRLTPRLFFILLGTIQ